MLTDSNSIAECLPAIYIEAGVSFLQEAFSPQSLLRMVLDVLDREIGRCTERTDGSNGMLLAGFQGHLHERGLRLPLGFMRIRIIKTRLRCRRRKFCARERYGE
jgi:hypothetical protein